MDATVTKLHDLPAKKSQWVIMQYAKHYVLGPFQWVTDAERYAHKIGLRDTEYKIKEMIDPINGV